MNKIYVFQLPIKFRYTLFKIKGNSFLTNDKKQLLEVFYKKQLLLNTSQYSQKNTLVMLHLVKPHFGKAANLLT